MVSDLFCIWDIMLEIQCINLSSGDVCSDGCVHHDGICYLFCSTYMLFKDARSNCAAANSTLLSIPNEEVNDFLKEQ